MKYIAAMLFFITSISFAQETSVDEKEKCEENEQKQVDSTKGESDLSDLCAGVLATGAAAAGAAGTGPAAEATIVTLAKGLSAKAVVASGVGLGALAALNESDIDNTLSPSPRPPIDEPTETPTTTPSTSDTGTSSTNSTGSTSGTSSTVSG